MCLLTYCSTCRGRNGCSCSIMHLVTGVEKHVLRRVCAEADMCSAPAHVRFTPKSDIRSVANASCWSCGARRRSYDGNFHKICEGVVRRSSEPFLGPGV